MYRMGDSWYLSYSRFSEFGGTITGCPTTPLAAGALQGVTGLAADDSMAAKSMADDKGGRYYFGWIPDRADRSDRGEWFWGGILRAPHAVSRSSTAGELEVALPQAIGGHLPKARRLDLRPMEGEIAAAGRRGSRNRSARSPTASLSSQSLGF